MSAENALVDKCLVKLLFGVTKASGASKLRRLLLLIMFGDYFLRYWKLGSGLPTKQERVKPYFLITA